MNCEDFQRALYDYLDEALGDRATAEIGRHLGQCAACRELAARERALARSMHRSLADAAEGLRVRPGMGRDLAAALQRRPFPPVAWLGSRTSRGFRVSAAAAAALAAGLFLSRESARPRPGHPALPVPRPGGTPAAWTVDVPTGSPSYVFEIRRGAVVDSVDEDGYGAHAGSAPD